MNYVGSRFIRQCGRLSIGSAVCEQLNLPIEKKVIMFIKNDSIYIVSNKKKGFGFAVTFEKQLGRFAIPIDIIRTMSLKTGDEMDVYVDYDGTIIIKRATHDREINIVRELAKKNCNLSDDEKKTIDMLLTKMLDG